MALATLRGVGLNPVPSQEPSTTVASGLVISQSPVGRIFGEQGLACQHRRLAGARERRDRRRLRPAAPRRRPEASPGRFQADDANPSRARRLERDRHRHQSARGNARTGRQHGHGARLHRPGPGEGAGRDGAAPGGRRSHPHQRGPDDRDRHTEDVDRNTPGTVLSQSPSTGSVGARRRHDQPDRRTGLQTGCGAERHRQKRSARRTRRSEKPR